MQSYSNQLFTARMRLKLVRETSDYWELMAFRNADGVHCPLFWEPSEFRPGGLAGMDWWSNGERTGCWLCSGPTRWARDKETLKIVPCRPRLICRGSRLCGNAACFWREHHWRNCMPPAITLASRDMTFRLFGGAAAIPGTRLENSGNAQQTGHRQYGTVAHQGYQ